MAEFDPTTLDRWRRLGPRTAFTEAREALLKLGATSSDDLLDVYEELVEQGLLSWEDISSFEDEAQ